MLFLGNVVILGSCAIPSNRKTHAWFMQVGLRWSTMHIEALYTAAVTHVGYCVCLAYQFSFEVKTRE